MSKKKSLILGISILLIGGCLFGFFLSKSISSSFEDFAKVTVPGTQTIELGETGKYYMLLNKENRKEYVSFSLSVSNITTGENIGLNKATEFSSSRNSRLALVDFEILTPGKYEFKSSFPESTTSKFPIYISKDRLLPSMLFMVVGIAIFVVLLIISIIVIRKPFKRIQI